MKNHHNKLSYIICTVIGYILPHDRYYLTLLSIAKENLQVEKKKLAMGI